MAGVHGILEWLIYCPGYASCLRQSLCVSYFKCNQEGWLAYNEFWKKTLTHQGWHGPGELDRIFLLSILNHVVPSLLRLRRALWAPKVLEFSELLCAVLSLVLAVGYRACIEQALHFSYCSGGLTLCRTLHKASGLQQKSSRHFSAACCSCLWWSAPFPPAFFQAVPCSAAGVTVLSRNDDLVTPAVAPLSPAPSASRGKLGSWLRSAGDNPRLPGVLLPASLLPGFSLQAPDAGLLCSSHWPPLSFSITAVSLHLENLRCVVSLLGRSCFSFSLKLQLQLPLYPHSEWPPLRKSLWLFLTRSQVPDALCGTMWL